MKNVNKQTKAFTMLELVFVIVVLGILASLAMPRLDRDLRQEAGDNILSAIRYTQHLALNDDKTNPSINDWQKELWTIKFSQNGGYWHYTIGSDTNRLGEINKIESAIDPLNGLYIYNNSSTLQADESPNIFIGKKYGIKDVTFNNCGIATGTTEAKHIAFDNLGRPFRGVLAVSITNNYNQYMSSTTCQIKFDFETTGITALIISIAKETGYAHIVGQVDS